MSEEPQGQGRQADITAQAVVVAKIGIGEIETDDDPIPTKPVSALSRLEVPAEAKCAIVRIVLADDHPLIRRGVEGVLAGSNFAIVASVASGAAAISAISVYNPEIVILDVNMPEGNGIEVLEAMRGRGDMRPVVLLAAEFEDRKLLAALDVGVEGIVMKTEGEENLGVCLEALHRGERHVPVDLLTRAERFRASDAEKPFSRLTPREAEMARMVGKGMRNKDIAKNYKLSEGAIKFALHAVFRKLEVATRTELALLIQRHGY